MDSVAPTQADAPAGELRRVGVITALPGEARCLGSAAPRSGGPAALGPGVRLWVSGIGPARAAHAAEAALRADARALLVCGLAGGLEPGLKAGALVLAEAVADAADGSRWDTDAAWRRHALARLPDAHAGTLVSQRTPVCSVADKARLRERFGALAVDMESAAVAAVAARHRVPFLAVRSIVDPASLALPCAATEALDDAGRLQPLALLRAILYHPGELPDLGRLAVCNRRALHSLRILGRALNESWSPA